MTTTTTKIVSMRDQLIDTWNGPVPNNTDEYHKTSGHRFRLYREEKESGVTREAAFAAWKTRLEAKLNGN